MQTNNQNLGKLSNSKLVEYLIEKPPFQNQKIITLKSKISNIS